jgi:hypothetical protein
LNELGNKGNDVGIIELRDVKAYPMKSVNNNLVEDKTVVLTLALTFVYAFTFPLPFSFAFPHPFACPFPCVTAAFIWAFDVKAYPIKSVKNNLLEDKTFALALAFAFVYAFAFPLPFGIAFPHPLAFPFPFVTVAFIWVFANVYDFPISIPLTCAFVFSSLFTFNFALAFVCACLYNFAVKEQGKPPCDSCQIFFDGFNRRTFNPFGNCAEYDVIQPIANLNSLLINNTNWNAFKSACQQHFKEFNNMLQIVSQEDLSTNTKEKIKSYYKKICNTVLMFKWNSESRGYDLVTQDWTT